MKKRLFILSIFLIFCFVFFYMLFFFNKKENIPVMDSNKTDNEISNTEEPDNTLEPEKYIDTNPIKVGLYDFDESIGKRFLVSEYSDTWKYHTDINSFNVFFTNKDYIDASRIPICFDKYANEYEQDVSEYRIGYTISFSTKDEEINKTILSPKDTEDFFDYLEIYLYDGYHRKAGEWYSHTTEEEFNENTILTGIKLTAGKNISKINSDLKLTAFSYKDSNDFDVNNNYRGNSKYSIIVKRK